MLRTIFMKTKDRYFLTTSKPYKIQNPFSIQQLICYSLSWFIIPNFLTTFYLKHLDIFWKIKTLIKLNRMHR